ncbi:hypothetical protein [Moorena sp. SIO4G3]|uniref:hypothetical protein n=1 Tax=Moorena sp. SIO4G3 TaxID=2607821 RepID=UPI00142AA6F2|nr:hypothetical protein [Moorena sp. SIO4G3]NEO82562.1 hypothetical protein [Moorena sp. SIO4G3]
MLTSQLFELFQQLFYGESQHHVGSFMDQEAIISEILRPGQEWQVFYQASYWKARCIQSEVGFQPGDSVHVVGR